MSTYAIIKTGGKQVNLNRQEVKQSMFLKKSTLKLLIRSNF